MATKQELTTRLYNWAAGEKVSYTATHGQSAAQSAPEVIVVLTTAGYIKVGSNPTAAATAGSMYLAAGVPFHLQLNPGDKISAVRDTADGAMYLIPVA